jgi:hypothetical protein
MLLEFFSPMSPTIHLENIVAILHQLHPFPSKHVIPLIFNYQQEHTFTLNKTLFVQALTIAHVFEWAI